MMTVKLMEPGMHLHADREGIAGCLTLPPSPVSIIHS